MRSPHKNPAGQIPVLELDDGTIISEVTAIIEYFEEVCPDPFLVGSTAKERAEARMWARRVDLAVMEPMSMAFKYGIGKNYFEKRITVYPEAAESMKKKAQDGLVWLDNVLAGKVLHEKRACTVLPLKKVNDNPLQIKILRIHGNINNSGIWNTVGSEEFHNAITYFSDGTNLSQN